MRSAAKVASTVLLPDDIRISPAWKRLRLTHVAGLLTDANKPMTLAGAMASRRLGAWT